MGQDLTDKISLDAFVFPKRATMWHEDSNVTNGNTIARDDAPGVGRPYVYNIIAFQDTPADADAFTQGALLQAGTYTFSAAGEKNTDGGIIDWSLDGIDFETGQDWYNGSIQRNQIQTGTVVIAEDGWHTLEGTVNGQNASSGDFFIKLVKMWFRQSSD